MYNINNNNKKKLKKNGLRDNTRKFIKSDNFLHTHKLHIMVNLSNYCSIILLF